MVASKQDESAPEAPAETLPTEVKKEAPKKTMLLAVIVAVIVVIAAVAAAVGLGLFGGNDDEPVNSAPTAGARATSDTTILIDGSVSFVSTGTDNDGTIVNYTWAYGDGVVDKGIDLNETTHEYNYGGSYLVYHMTEDNLGATADNEAAMIPVGVVLFEPMGEDDPGASPPYAFLSVNEQIIEANTTVTFNMTGTAQVMYDTEGEEYYYDWGALDSATIDFGDGSDVADVDITQYMTVDHEYTESGHYAAMFTATSNDLSTSVIVTVHVLTPEATYVGVIKNPDAFIEATIGEPSSLDPAVDYETAGGEILQSVYQTLIWYSGSSPNELEAVLATEVPSIENELISEDGLNYTFDLRTDVVFHDGTEMTSEDVTYSIQRVLQIHDPSGPGWMLEQVLTDYIGFSVGDNVSTYLDGSNNVTWIREVLEPLGYDHDLTESDIKNVSEVVVEAVDDDTVVFHLTHPYPGFLKIMAYTVASVVSKDYVEANGGIVGGEQSDFMNRNTCGSGPYELVAWEVGSKIHLTRFAGYWGDAPELKDVYIIKANDVNTRILMLQAGDADCIYLPIKYEDVVADTTKYSVTKGLPSFDLTFGAFNFNIDYATANTNYGGDITADFFSDVHMRKAFTHLINYSLYIENVNRGNAIQPNGVIPEGMFGYDASIPKYSYDLEAAQAELEQTSWWTDGFTIPLFYNSGNVGRMTACEMIKAGLDSIEDGRFTATITGLDWPVFLDEVYDTNGYMPFYVIGWGPDYADPDDYTTPMLDSGYGTYPYYTGYQNTSIDTLVRQAAAELDDTVRADLYSEISQLVYEDAPYLWLTQPSNFHVERSWVNGYMYNPMFGGLYFPLYSKG
jgi:peptide/nickel transport system substrate-binding protein